MSVEPTVFCYADAVDFLVSYLGGAAQDAEQMLVRRAVQAAYRLVTAQRTWQYLFTQATIPLQAPYNTGTIQYVQASRRCVLTGGTWPSWANYGRIGFVTTDGSYQIFPVESVPASTLLQLPIVSNPGADVAAGTSFELFESVYPLPPDFHKLCDPTTFQTWASEFVSPSDWQWLEWHGRVSGSPVRWTIMADPQLPGGQAIFVQPYPSFAQPLTFMYQRLPRPLRYMGLEATSYAGTVSITLGLTAVVGSGTSFNSAMVGSMLRLSSSATRPDGMGGLNPYLEQRRIASVTDATHLTLDNPCDNQYSGAGYLITDPVDLPDIFMDAMLWACRLQYSSLARSDQRESDFEHYQWAMRLAAENDATAAETERRVGRQYRYYDRGWFSPVIGSTTP